MIRRRIAALAAVVVATAAAAGCAGSDPAVSDSARPPTSAGAPRTTATIEPVPIAVESTEPQPSDTQPDDTMPDHEELAEPAPSTTEDPTTTTEDGGDPSSSSTSTTRREPLQISTKREPTGPGVPSIPAYTQSREEILYFECVTFRESSNDPGVINSSSGAAGLFQFLQSTWDLVARRIGRGDLIGVNPALASVPTQRYLAHVLFVWQGSSPWVSDGCQVPSPPTTSTTTTTSPSTTTTTTEAPPESPPSLP